MLLCTQKADILLRVIASQKSGGTSSRKAAHLHISHDKDKISRECPEDFFKT